MSGDVRAPPEEVSVRSVIGAWSHSHWKIEYQKVVNNSRDETTLVRLLWSGMTPRTSQNVLCSVRKSGELPKGLLV